MLKTVSRPLTIHDYRDLPEGPPHYQLIEGEIEMSPSPNRAHQDILLNLIDAFREHLRKNAVGRIYVAPFDVYLTDLNVYQPDLVFISKARANILTEQGTEGAPDLVIEILSTRTAKFDRGVKRDIYSRTGVLELWLVDPERKQVQVFDFAQSADTPAGTYSKGQKVKSRVLPKLSISVTSILQV